MRFSRAVLSQLLLTVCLCRTVPAQGQPLAVGARVRVTMPRPGVHGYVGTIERMSADTLFVRNRSKVPTPFVVNQLTRLDVSRGRTHPMWSRTAPLWMPLASGAVGAIGGAAKPGSRTSRKSSGEFMGAVGAVIGLVAGIVTWAATETDKWETVPTGAGSRTSSGPSLHLAPTSRGVAIELRRAF